jgi:hypothetical protein
MPRGRDRVFVLFPAKETKALVSPRDYLERLLFNGIFVGPMTSEPVLIRIGTFFPGFSRPMGSRGFLISAQLAKRLEGFLGHGGFKEVVCDSLIDAPNDPDLVLSSFDSFEFDLEIESCFLKLPRTDLRNAPPLFFMPYSRHSDLVGFYSDEKWDGKPVLSDPEDARYFIANRLEFPDSMLDAHPIMLSIAGLLIDERVKTAMEEFIDPKAFTLRALSDFAV